MIKDTYLTTLLMHESQGSTPLHYAAWHSQLAVLKKLLTSGASVNIQDHQVSLAHDIFKVSFPCVSGKTLCFKLVSAIYRHGVVLIHASSLLSGVLGRCEQSV